MKPLPQIENFTSRREAERLAELAAGRRVLEVGTFKGFGAVLMAQAGARTVWAVDWHRGDSHLGERDTLFTWWTNVRRHGVDDRVVGLVGRSEDVLPYLGAGSFDVAFIDAEHTYEAALGDLWMAYPLVGDVLAAALGRKEGGILAVHDYDPEVWPEVVRAVDDFLGGIPRPVLRAGCRLPTSEMRLEVVDSLAVIYLDET